MTVVSPRNFRWLAGVALVPMLVASSRSSERAGVLHVRKDVRSSAPRSIVVFAGGCFWSMERPFDHVPGVISTRVGFEGGNAEHVSYEQVNTGKTGHAESVEVTYDSTKVSYEKLLDVYWHNIDPFTREAQFCDHGNEYRTVIFYNGEAQKQTAEKTRDGFATKLASFGPIVTQIVPASQFWPAEDYHQHYAAKNPIRYELYRVACGRDDRLKKIWGDAAEPYVPSDTVKSK
ncbi:MAG: peptide-methionine (S)-S-oxide reductase MsrA [Gemmatimonadota bacterium]|nr:peptide-methionine (S)-S-oxide reductase MsrA [Gemmatimonadota bacterium]